MRSPERSVLHVLPHPGGGGETYVGLLEEMPGYEFSRTYLASSSSLRPWELARGVARTTRGARHHDLVHVHGEVAAGLCLPLLATRPSVVTLHGLHLIRRLGGIGRSAAALNLRAVLRSANRTICVSQAEHDELQRIVGTTATRRAVVVRNGVRIPPPRNEDQRAVIRRELGLPENDVVGIWVGSLDDRKDPLTAIRAANRAEVTLLVVGDGPLRQQVERAASMCVRVLGRRADVLRLLQAADFYLLTSHREGLSLALLEAMAAGLAPVASDIPENAEAVGETGVMFRLGDDEALASALALFGVQVDRFSSLGARARSRIAELFDATTMIEATRTTYETVLSRRASYKRLLDHGTGPREP